MILHTALAYKYGGVDIFKRDIGRMGNYMEEGEVSILMEVTILESSKKAV